MYSDIVIPRSAFTFLPQAGLDAVRRVSADQVENDFLEQGQVLQSVVFSNLAAVFAEIAIEHPVKLVLYPPMGTHRLGHFLRSASVGQRTEHAGQTTITLTGLHAHFKKARAALMRVSALVQGWVAQAAEQLNSITVWTLVCTYLKHVLTGIAPPTAYRLLENNAVGIG